MRDVPLARIATPGRCTCGANVVRGTDDAERLVTADIYDTDAATELLAHLGGRGSYTLTLAKVGGVYLTRRTRDDIVRKPIGYTRDRVVLEHHCRKRDA